MNVTLILDVAALGVAVVLLVAALGPKEPPRNPILRGIRDIFTPIEGKPLPTPHNALVWLRRRRVAEIENPQAVDNPVDKGATS